jgi:hypothetical protein
LQLRSTPCSYRRLPKCSDLKSRAYSKPNFTAHASHLSQHEEKVYAKFSLRACMMHVNLARCFLHDSTFVPCCMSNPGGRQGIEIIASGLVSGGCRIEFDICNADARMGRAVSATLLTEDCYARFLLSLALSTYSSGTFGKIALASTPLRTIYR